MRDVFGENYYTVAEAAEKLEKNTKTVFRMIKDGRLEANTKSRPFLISETAIKKYLAGGAK